MRDVTVLKAPHHGSDNGYTREFLDAVRPEVVVISVGDNSYGHPGPEALAAYESMAEAVYRTDYDGQVTIRGYRDGRYEVRSRGRLVREGCEGDPEGACVERLETAPVTALLAATSASSFLGLWVFADAPGNDHQNPNGEYAVLESRASDPIDIGGWLLCDGASHCFRFPSGSVVSAGGQIVVYTGSGVSDGVAFFMNSGRAVWNNDGDTATLYDSDGTVIVRHVYE